MVTFQQSLEQESLQNNFSNVPYSFRASVKFGDLSYSVGYLNHVLSSSFFDNVRHMEAPH